MRWEEGEGHEEEYDRWYRGRFHRPDYLRHLSSALGQDYQSQPSYAQSPRHEGLDVEVEEEREVGGDLGYYISGARNPCGMPGRR